jgi:hypothetical protein
MKQIALPILFLLLSAPLAPGFAANNTSDYAVVLCKTTLADGDWKKVTDAIPSG